MPVPAQRSESEPGGTTRSVPQPIQTHLASPALSSPGEESPPSAGPGAYDDTVIPPSHEARTLVLCFDGTGDQFDADNSNIVQFFSMLKKDDKSQQMVYYQAGIGTYTIPQIATPLVAKIQKNIDMAIANHLDAHVMSGYEFLMENYHAEDKICIFGFSRGAYTARALAGMIHKVGLLPAGNHQQVPFAYKMFTNDNETGWQQSTVFKKAFSVDVEIEFLGVWDTVASVGLIPHRLPFTASNTAVRYFRHAISLDEHRAKFKSNHWHLRHDHDQKGTKLGEMPRSNQRHPHYHSKNHHHEHGKKKYMEERYNNGPWTTDVLEVWFAGCHCDVGGGSVPNGTRNTLARIPLRWMIRECFKANTGIQFYREAFKQAGLDPSTLYPFVTPRPAALKATDSIVRELTITAHASEPTDGTFVESVQGSPTAATTFKSEEDEELADALSPIYDELKIAKGWWILEFFPIKQREQSRQDTTWKHYWSWNLGRPREVPKPNPHKDEKVLIHRSVKIRMEAEGLQGGKYEPRAKFDHMEHEYVD